MKKLTGILVFLLTIFCVNGYSAPSKGATFSKRYRNEKLIVVLEDLCKRNGYTLSIVDEIDEEKRITAEFKNARTGTVLRKVLDKDFQGKVKKGVLTISRKPSPPVTYTVRSDSAAQIIEEPSQTRKIYMDTVFTVRCSMKTVEDEETKDDEKDNSQSSIPSDRAARKRTLNSQFSILLGSGYSSMGYNLHSDGKEIGSLGLNAQLRYLLYFTPNWGVGAGIGFANYGSTGTLNTTTAFEPTVHDSDIPVSSTIGEAYEHRVKTHDWTETQRTYMLDIPVFIQCLYPIEQVSMPNGPMKIYADLGANIGLPLSSARQLKGGSIEHTGWYKPWKLELTGMDDHDFYSEDASVFGTEKQKLKIRMPAIGIMADVGVAIPVHPVLDLLLGVYANFVANNLCSAQQDIGWRNPNETGYKAHDFMNPYTGIIGTQYASSVHPWQAGIRVGIQINPKPQQPKRKEPDKHFTRINVCDTTFQLQPREETIAKTTAVQEIRHALEKAVIWFDLNSTEPKLEPADILVRIAESLKQNPDWKILVTGHASRDGDKAKNQQLSEQRAQAIVDILLSLGVRPEQMQSRGEGVSRDYSSGSHELSLDRRVEITLIEN